MLQDLTDKMPLNRCALLNVRFDDVNRPDSFDCFIFHDIGLLPQNERNYYSCLDGQARQLAFSVDIYD